MVKTFIAEWLPVFPIIGSVELLKRYTTWLAGDCAADDFKSLALLNLVFSIAATSNEVRLHLGVLWQRYAADSLICGSIEFLTI
jgi:hypothetical protein